MKKKLIYLGEETRTSQKSGNEYTMIKLADAKKFENYDFFKKDDLKQSKNLSQGEEVQVQFALSKNGYKTNIDLVAIEVV